MQTKINSTSQGLQPIVIPKGHHPFELSDIDDNALSVLRRLNAKGYDAYLVGGCIRDKMMGKQAKDFDIATNATPEQIKACFRNCRLIGRRFRLAHIVFGRDVIEVATFRGHHSDQTTPEPAVDSTQKVGIGKDRRERFDGVVSKQDQQGQLLRDNVFGSIEEDAERRDFSFNAMYFNAKDMSIIDFANGIDAIKNKQIQLIGDPETRFREDPVRMLRAIRFSAKLGMSIPDDIGQQIKKLAHLLANIPPARLFEEVSKLLISGQGLATFKLLHEYGLFAQLFPQLSPLLADNSCREMKLVERVLINTDNRLNNDLRVTPAFIYAAFLWYPLEERTQQIMLEAGVNEVDAFNIAMSEVLHRQTQRIMIPKRFSIPMREIWQLQKRLSRRFGRRAFVCFSHARFRAAYDFLLIRAEIEGGKLDELGQWWTEFQEVSAEARKDMVSALLKTENNGPSGRRAKRRPRKRKAN